MGEPRKRLDGWKSIAAHFNRNRATVIRWANDDGLPVQRVSGKAGASVWAWADELEAWLEDRAAFSQAASPQATVAAPIDTAALQGPGSPIAADPPSVAANPRTRFPGSILYISLVGLALLAGGASFVMARLPKGSTTPPTARGGLPSDTLVADTYLRARDEWSTRTPDGLNRALADFSSVIMRDPAFAPAYTGVADTYIAANQYAAMPEADAFPKAEAAARAALGIDPHSAGAQRALGFVAYWYRQDFPTAERLFLAALRAAPNDAQTHFWFGNILFDDGRAEAGLQELRQARLLDPGSRAIETDYAWSQWLMGPEDAGVSELREVAQQDPSHSVALKFLSYIDLVRGDYKGYLSEIGRFATLQSNRPLQLEATSETEAFRLGGDKALLTALAKRPWSTDAPYWIPHWRMTAISLLGSRSELLSSLRAAPRHALWRSWRLSQARVARWRDDNEVAAAFQAATANAPPSQLLDGQRLAEAKPSR
jgi:tetratricopeptide (TPR) repeat protein